MSEHVLTAGESIDCGFCRETSLREKRGANDQDTKLGGRKKERLNILHWCNGSGEIPGYLGANTKTRAATGSGSNNRIGNCICDCEPLFDLGTSWRPQDVSRWALYPGETLLSKRVRHSGNPAIGGIPWVLNRSGGRRARAAPPCVRRCVRLGNILSLQRMFGMAAIL